MMNLLILLIYLIQIVSTQKICDDPDLPLGSECKTSICVFKCTPKDIVYWNRRSVDIHDLEKNYTVRRGDFSEIAIYDKNIRITNKKIDIILTNAREVYNNSVFVDNPAPILVLTDPSYLQKDGSLFSEQPNFYNRFITIGEKYHFCVDYNYFQVNNSKELRANLIWNFLEEQGEPTFYVPTSVSTSMLLVSSTFLALVVIVHALLPTRTISRFNVLGYASSRLCAFITLTALQIDNEIKTKQLRVNNACEDFSIAVYFFYLASFFWMNVMSFDVCWCIRSNKTVSEHFSVTRFLGYSVYAFGVPLVMTVTVYIVHNTDLTAYPYIVKPNFGVTSCFIDRGERFLYIYTPLIIILVLNTIYFIVASVTILKVDKEMSRQNDSASSKKRLNKFRIHIKLTMMMGLTWILELGATFKPGPWWVICDIFNTIGLSIFVFVLFVCDRYTLKALAKRFTWLKRFLPQSVNAIETTKTESQTALKSNWRKLSSWRKESKQKG